MATKAKTGSKSESKNRKLKQSEVLAEAQAIEETPPPAEESTLTEGEIVASPEATKSNEVAIINDEKALGSLASIGGVSTDELKLQLQAETDQRAVIKQFVQYHLKNDVDYGKIHVVSRDKCPDQYNCQKDYHYSKAVLFKPGMEKLFSLFKITTRLEKDEETYEMLPDIKQLVAYKCVMMRGDQLIGEGRGSATVGDSRRDVNATIKIAQKRARMDACLSLGFSEYFAQDLDDPDYASAAQMTNQKVAAAADRIDSDEFGLVKRDPNLTMNDEERTILFKYFQLRGHQAPEMKLILAENGIKDPLNMTSGEARTMMKMLKDNLYASPKLPDAADPDLPIIDVNADIDGSNASEQATNAMANELNVVVDEDMRNHVAARALEIGLNSVGKSWLMKKITGKQWSKWQDFTDDEWRRAYEVVEGILDTSIDIDPGYLTSEANGQRAMNFTEPVNQEEKDESDLAKEIMEGGEDHPIPEDLK
jgi:hypothetical protein